MTTRKFHALLLPTLLFIAGCEEEKSTAGAPTSERPASQPSVAAPAKTTPPPPPTNTAPPEPKHDCPEGSSGEGSFNKPCEAKGKTRAMEVAWTGKMTDEGPSFKVTNTSKLVILYGRFVAYFYDKAGKQLQVTEEGGKPRPHQKCSGNIFGGVMKVGEKAVLTFSCVKKKHVPEGTAKVEGELQMVGFADSSGEKVDFYWKNDDLAPDERAKGGIKK
jgi:hypothetical protein